MLTKTKVMCISLCVVNLSACMTGGQHDYSNAQSYDYQTSPLYPEGYDNTVIYSNDSYNTTTQQTPVVPESYHVGSTRSPIASKDLDKTWVTSQNPASYTIQIAEGDKAARVAGTLQKAPKNERMAEVKYQHDGKEYYKGLYGTYPNQEAANKALNALPDDVKQGAAVQTWGSVQQNITE